MRNGRAAWRQAQPGTVGGAGACSHQGSAHRAVHQPAAPPSGPGVIGCYLPSEPWAAWDPGTWSHLDTGGPIAARGLTRWARREQQGSVRAGTLFRQLAAGCPGPLSPSLTSWGPRSPPPTESSSYPVTTQREMQTMALPPQKRVPLDCWVGVKAPMETFKAPPADVTLEPGRASGDG